MSPRGAGRQALERPKAEPDASPWPPSSNPKPSAHPGTAGEGLRVILANPRGARAVNRQPSTIQAPATSSPSSSRPALTAAPWPALRLDSPQLARARWGTAPARFPPVESADSSRAILADPRGALVDVTTRHGSREPSPSTSTSPSPEVSEPRRLSARLGGGPAPASRERPSTSARFSGRRPSGNPRPAIRGALVDVEPSGPQAVGTPQRPSANPGKPEPPAVSTYPLGRQEALRSLQPREPSSREPRAPPRTSSAPREPARL